MPRQSEAAARGAPIDPATIIYVVRHAEAAAPSGDPSLSDEGLSRSRRLATLMANKQLAAIDTTQLKRAFETGKVVGDAMGIEGEVVPIDPANIDAYAPALGAHIKQQHAGKATLVVGHSNTVPAIVEALSGTSVPPIQHTEYDRLYTITIAANGTAQLEGGTY
jgi:broad specificity phosphatase PhoE